MRPNGWRKTDNLAEAEALADQGVALEASKGRCLVAVKRVAAHLGLKAGDLLLLDTLAAFTQAQDWGEGQRAIVWPSNALLMAQTGFSRTSLKRHARRLAEAGLIAFRDSPNGKRWGHRNRAGDIVEAYGFDLSPLAAHAEAFEVLAAEIAAERALCQRLRRRLTGLRRTIRDRLERSEGAQDIQAEYDTLLAIGAPARMTAQDLMRALQAYEGLLTRLEAQSGTDLACAKEDIPDPKGAETGPHLEVTKEHQTVISRAEKQQGESPKPQEVLRACPEFALWAQSLGRPLHHWPDLWQAAGHLRAMIAVKDDSWALAIARLGQSRAALAIALIFEKVHAGRVAAPDAYLRGMLAKEQAGALHLKRSLAGQIYATSGRAGVSRHDIG